MLRRKGSRESIGWTDGRPFELVADPRAAAVGPHAMSAGTASASRGHDLRDGGLGDRSAWGDGHRGHHVG